MKRSWTQLILAISTLTLTATSAWADTTLIANTSNDDCADGSGGLQQCLDFAQDNGDADVIQLEPGEYHGHYVYNAAISAEDFPLTIENRSEQHPVISGDVDVGLELIASGFGDTNTLFTVRGLVFTHGDGGNGGGLDVGIIDADVVVEKCEFTDNDATLGGAISVTNGNDGQGSVTLSENLFTGNKASSVGGAVFVAIDSGDITLTGNVFKGNSAGIFEGGGAKLKSEGGNFTIDGNVFSDNSASASGGAVHVEAVSGASEVTFTNNLMVKNQAGNDSDGEGSDDGANGGAISVLMNDLNSQLTVTHNTMAGNVSQDRGGAISVEMDYASQSAKIYNNIMVGNTATGLGDDVYSNEDSQGGNDPGSVELFNNLYADFFSVCKNNGGTCVSEGENLIGQDPMFVDAAAGDYALKSDSPAVDQAKADAPALPETDLAGNDRVQGERPDMGAFEFQPETEQDAPPADQANNDNGKVQGGCSLGTATDGNFAGLSWLMFGAVAWVLRKKA